MSTHRSGGLLRKMLGRGDELPCCNEPSITGTPPTDWGGDEEVEMGRIPGAAVTIEARGILFIGAASEVSVPWLEFGASEVERQRSLDDRSLVGVFASEEWPELVSVAMSLPVRLGAGMMMFLLTASGRGMCVGRAVREIAKIVYWIWKPFYTENMYVYW